MGPPSCGSTASSSIGPRICATPCTPRMSRTARAVSVCHKDCCGSQSAWLVGSFTAPCPRFAQACSLLPSMSVPGVYVAITMCVVDIFDVVHMIMGIA